MPSALPLSSLQREGEQGGGRGRGTKRGRQKFLSERKRTTGEKKGGGKEKEGGRRGTDIVASERKLLV